MDDAQRCGGFLEGLVGCEGWQEVEAALGENISMFLVNYLERTEQ